MARRLRLDAELVRRNLARSREHASELIAAGRVTVAGATATKPATGVTTDAAIVVKEGDDGPDYVSRGGHKLAGALDAFEPAGLSVEGHGWPSTPGHPRGASPTYSCAEGLPLSSPSMSVMASSPGRSGRIPG